MVQASAGRKAPAGIIGGGNMKQEIIRIDLNGVNCYLIKSGIKYILMDTGGHLIMDKEYTDRKMQLMQALNSAGCTAENLELVLLTHGDNDHAGNAAQIRTQYHAKIAIHKLDQHLVESPAVSDYMASFQYRQLPYRLFFKIMRKTIEKAAVRIINDFEAFTPDIWIDEHFTLSDYGFSGEIIHLPGHTPGSIALLTQDGDLIAGDIYTHLRKPVPAINAMDFKMLSDSINRLEKYPIRKVYPGHGEPFDFQKLLR